MSKIIGRHREQSQLLDYLHSPKSEFVAVYGRRRVGKTFLIRNTFENRFDFQLNGLANGKLRDQLGQFNAALLTYGELVNFRPTPARDWLTAFRQLNQLLEKLPPPVERGKYVLFLDELPWLDTPNSRFLMGLENFWNGYASARDDILLIVCGSAASWMINQLLRNKGGLYNRITDRLKLSPFDLHDTELFLQSRGLALSRYQMLQVYMTLGGIPFYLDFLRPGQSTVQNIDRLCFGLAPRLDLEFDVLFASLFSKHERHRRIVAALASKSRGLTRKEIVAATGISNGGGLTRMLRELEESTFLRTYRSYGKRLRETYYQLIDPFTLFYFRFMKNADREDDQYWTNLYDSPGYYAWAGLAFEMVCLHHIGQIKQALGIGGIQTKISVWRSPEAQIDLVIDRRDQVMNLCEMKFSIAPFVVDQSYATRLAQKVETFRRVTGTEKSLFLTLVSAYGLQKNAHAGIVQNEVTMDDLFTSMRN